MNMFNVLTSASKVFAAFLGLGVMFLFLTIAIAVIFIVFTIVGNYKLFQKAGYNGWEAIVPFYNLWILALNIEYSYVILLTSGCLQILIHYYI